MVATRLLPFAPAAVAEAAALIRRGEPVAVPTETVYGLAADATCGEAVARIYAAKGRPSFNPLIVHVADLAAAEAIAILPPPALRLAERFWPGALTIVAPLREDAGIARLASAGLPTIAIRVPAHPAMRAVMAAADRPLAAPSANRSGAISPTRAEHVLHTLAGHVPLVIDDGATGLGLESTIVAVAGDGLRLLRPGPIAGDTLAETAGLPLIGGPGDAISAPGQLASHYAPRKAVRLDATHAESGELLIGYGTVAGDMTLSATGDPIEAAARLFDLLHLADALPGSRIAIAPVPEDGIGAAINDRLRRAAADRG